MRITLTADRVRSILDGVRTEQEAAKVLRQHRIRYSYSTTGGTLHIRIPARSGIVTVTRTASRTAPLRIAAAGSFYPFPVPSWSWDD